MVFMVVAIAMNLVNQSHIMSWSLQQKLLWPWVVLISLIIDGLAGDTEVHSLKIFVTSLLVGEFYNERIIRQLPRTS